MVAPLRVAHPLVYRKALFMAKALIGYLNSDLRDPRMAADNARLRARVSELETLVLRLSEENDKLIAARAAEILDTSALQEMQPA